MNEPRMPSRVRIHRPDLWRDEVSGQLRPDERDLYAGLATITDDAGWLLWRPAMVAALLYPYDAPARRLRDLANRANALAAAGLLVTHPCGCAEMPRMGRDFAQKGGDPTHAIAEHHAGHRSTPEDSVSLRSATARVSGSDSGLGSGSVSDSVQARRRHPSGAASDDRADVVALLEGGWHSVTARQRQTLDRLADRHGGPDWAARVIRECPEGEDYLAHVKAADLEWRAKRLREADEEERRAQAQRASEQDRAGAAVTVAALGRRTSQNGHTPVHTPVPLAAEPDPGRRAARRRQAVDGVLVDGIAIERVTKHLEPGDAEYLARGERPPDLHEAHP